MRIDAAPVPGSGAIKGEPGPLSAVPLEEGQELEVRIIANDRDMVSMKTESGQLLRARLESDVPLSAGDRVTLTVTEKAGDTVFLSIRTPEVLASPRKGDAASVPVSRELAVFAAKLAQLRLPVSGETAAAMRDMMAADPEMTMDEAAFLASNKIPAGTPLADAAISLISDGAGTDKMAETMISLLENAPETANASSPTPETLSGTPDAPDRASVSAERGGGARSAPVAADTADKAERGGETRNAPDTADKAERGGETRNAPIAAAAADKAERGGETRNAPVVADTADRTERGGGARNAPLTEWLSGVLVGARDAKQTVLKFLSELPEFKDTPVKALDAFADRLVDVARQTAETGGDGAEKLTALLDGLFARLPARDEKGGETIRRAGEDLFAKLSLFEEALKSSDVPSKTALLAETEKLMNHAKVQNRIDQFVYMQLPIKLGEDRKKADLYVYRRRGGGKSADPDNVSVLLSLDLEHMGHLESFVEVKGREVSLRAEVSGEEAKSFFNENTAALSEMLSEISFKLTGAKATCSMGATTPLTALVSLSAHEKKPATGIDYII